MAILVNKKNREVKVIIPNMREFRTFYSDNEGVIPMFFKRDWEEEKQDFHWKPSEDELAKKHLDGYCMGREDTLREMKDFLESHFNCENAKKGTPIVYNTQSGTATATLDGNTSFTDGKPHDPSFTD